MQVQGKGMRTAGGVAADEYQVVFSRNLGQGAREGVQPLRIGRGQSQREGHPLRLSPFGQPGAGIGYELPGGGISVAGFLADHQPNTGDELLCPFQVH